MAGTSPAVVGSLFGDRYRVESLIGTGGMASVYRARDESLGRLVALKVLSGATAAADPAMLGREQSEIQLLASLSHPSLVTLFDAALLPNDTIEGEHLCLVMELVDGPDLGERIAAGRVDSGDVAQLTADIAEALHVVHENGIVHRDIKPANVLLGDSALPDREFRAKLADFGIASLVDSTRITATGTLIGTAAFLSPEQALGNPMAPSTDIYSLGLVVLEALTGTREFAGTMVESVSARLGRDPHIPASLGEDWVALLTAMTAREPAARPTALDVSVGARRILAREAGGTAPTHAATAVFAAPTAGLYSPTAVLDAPTAVLGGATEVLPGSDLPLPLPAPAPRAAPEPAATRSRRPRPAVWAIALAAAVLVLVLLLAVVIVPRLVGLTPEPGTSQELPANDGQLGVHLQQLLESVTP